MKTKFQIILITVLTAALLSACSMSEIKNNGLTYEQIATIDNLIIKELLKQKFVTITSKPKKSQFIINTEINNIAETMVIDTGASYSLLKKDNISRFNFKNVRISKDKEWIQIASATIDDMRGYFMIDTGAYMTIVNSAIIDKKFWQVKPQA